LTPAEITDFREQLTTALKSLSSLSSDFTQTKRLSYLEKPAVATGRLLFRSPNKIRWEYHTPKPSVTILDGNDNRQGKGGPGPLLAAALSGGDLFDDSRFSNTYYRDGPDYIVVQTPKDKTFSRLIKQAELVIDGRTWLVKRVEITDPSSDSTTLEFINQQKNTAIPTETFVRK